MVSYPSNALRCYATLSKPHGKVICPESRMNYCVKEVVSSNRLDCGKSLEFPFDAWDLRSSQCIYRSKSNSVCSSLSNTVSRKWQLIFLAVAFFISSVCCDMRPIESQNVRRSRWEKA